MNSAVIHASGEHILYDSEAVASLNRQWFEPDWLDRQGYLRGQALGRGTTWFFEIDGRQMVLRHYRRGGAVAPLLEDRYVRVPLERSRAWREWRLLADLRAQDLPVPRPLGARVRFDGLFYRCDLLTGRIGQAESLATRLREGHVRDGDWRQVGRTIRRFHDRGVCHADLNAHNILLDAGGGTHLIDFDRGRIRAPGRWRQSNLSRLLRSIRKVTGLDSRAGIQPDGWSLLMNGYDAAD